LACNADLGGSQGLRVEYDDEDARGGFVEDVAVAMCPVWFFLEKRMLHENQAVCVVPGGFNVLLESL
jgi:hypothetical protein